MAVDGVDLRVLIMCVKFLCRS